MTDRTASVGHTHFFPGARVELGTERVEAGRLVVRLSDGVEVDTELTEVGDPGTLVLAVPEFVTRAGATVAARVWSVRTVTSGDSGDVLILGQRTGLEVPPAPESLS